MGAQKNIETMRRHVGGVLRVLFLALFLLPFSLQAQFLKQMSEGVYAADWTELRTDYPTGDGVFQGAYELSPEYAPGSTEPYTVTNTAVTPPEVYRRNYEYTDPLNPSNIWWRTGCRLRENFTFITGQYPFALPDQPQVKNYPWGWEPVKISSATYWYLQGGFHSMLLAMEGQQADTDRDKIPTTTTQNGTPKMFGNFTLTSVLRQQTARFRGLDAGTGGYGGVIARGYKVYFNNNANNLAVTGVHVDGTMTGTETTVKGAVAFANSKDITLTVVFIGNRLVAQAVQTVSTTTTNTDTLDLTIPDAPAEGPVGLYSHFSAWAYKSLGLTSSFPSNYLVNVEIFPDRIDLVTDPAETGPLNVAVKLSNSLAEPIRVGADVAIQTWADTLGTNPLATASQIFDLNGTESRTVILPVGSNRLEGFYVMDAVFYMVDEGGSPVLDGNGQRIVYKRETLPLALQTRGTYQWPDTGRASWPGIILAPYDKNTVSTDPKIRNTYSHATAKLLSDYGFNGILESPNFALDTVRIYATYGIATISRGRYMTEKSVVGTLYSDEPTISELATLEAAYTNLVSYGKPVGTTMVGDAIGLAGGPEQWFWPLLPTWEAETPGLETVRTFRMYAIKKNHYDVAHPVTYKPYLTFASVFRIAALSGGERRWWFVPPSFGGTNCEAYYFQPSANEMKGMFHLAVAYGASAILPFALQSDTGIDYALIDQNLQPVIVNGTSKLLACKEVNVLIQTNMGLLSRLRYGHFSISNSTPQWVEAVPRKLSEAYALWAAGHSFVYVVNKDDESPHSVVLQIPHLTPGQTVHDIYSDTLYTVGADTGVALSLGPCDGALLDLGQPAPAYSGLGASPGAPHRLDPALAKAVSAEVSGHGVAILAQECPAIPYVAGDGVAVFDGESSNAGEATEVWSMNNPGPKCFVWNGGIGARDEEGFLPLESALTTVLSRIAAGSSSPLSTGEDYRRMIAANGYGLYWTFFPAVKSDFSPIELGAMIHLATAFGSRAVMVDGDGAALSGPQQTKVAEIAEMIHRNGRTIESLYRGGCEIRCTNPSIMAVPLSSWRTGKLYCYAINLTPEAQTTSLKAADIQNYNDRSGTKNGAYWTTATDLFSGTSYSVDRPTGTSPYREMTMTLAPGQGALLETDFFYPGSGVSTLPTDIPSAPTGFTAQAVSETEVILSWSHNQLNTSGTVTSIKGFQVERSADDGTNWKKQAWLDGFSSPATFTDITAPPNTALRYRVYAVRTTNQTLYSAPAEIQVSTPSVAADGIPGAWRRLYFQSGTIIPGTSGAADDPDGDGWSNLLEFRAQTNPNDAASGLSLGLRFLNVTDEVELSFLSRYGATYRMLSSGDLMSWTNWTSNLIGDGDTIRAEMAVGTNKTHFFRITLP